MLADLLDGLSGDAAVEGHKVHPVLGVEAHHIHEILGGQLRQIPLIVDHRVIHRHRADHHRALMGQLLPEGLGVAMAGQIHNGLRSQVHSAHNLLHFHIIILAVPRDPQVYVYLGAQHTAHPFRIQTGVPLVGTDGHLALCHQLPQLFHRQVLFLRHPLHLFRHDALSGCIHLCGISLHCCSSKKSKKACICFVI